MARSFVVETAFTPPPSFARAEPPQRAPLRVGLVQHRWLADADELRATLAEGIRRAADLGAKAVFLPELTLSRYPADVRAGANPGARAEDLRTGPTFTFATQAAKETGVAVHASLYERAEAADGLGFNTAILVSPDGELLGRTRKLHIPISDGYYEDTYFRPGPADDAYPIYRPAALDGAAIGMPTCWDEWFPEVSRMYSLGGAEILVYPTAIGSEPSFPAFDTQPLWQHVIVGNGITAGTFMVVPNRFGDEGGVHFYGSSFISDPYGRVLVQAPRDEAAVLVADLDLDQRRDWLGLFPFLTTRRPDTYARLTAPVDADHPYGAS
ncbi:nitrilase-related carbon-nitrogen hydrolase [Nocardia terpenica]|uniref:Hydrolase n=1 Tax=Nocardia terpenica TaxID=455432 RepID=A0A164MP27_9NOCA|nr:nitrilase-related carbon-nitrogen hydrolase [Nocardia terpenica]KZM73533.1 hydrolase [Nocardia terpenica]NQE87269.1 hydrolase [Nocardia terpenica]